MARLTKTFIDNVPLPTGSYKVHWDDRLKGYGLRVTAAGKKVFIVMGRVNGEAVGITIGPYGEWTEDEARNGRKDAKGNLAVDGARHLLQAMHDGKDPRATKKKTEAEKITLRKVADAYMARPGKLKQSSKDEIERHVSTTFKAWENKPIAAITEDDCQKRYKELLTKGLRGTAPAPGQANQAFAVLRALVNYAMRQHKAVTHNPVSALKDDWVTLKPKTSFIDPSKDLMIKVHARGV